MVFSRPIPHSSIAPRKKMVSPLKATKPTSTIVPNSHPDERRAYADFASRYGEAPYRRPLAELYSDWNRFNNEFFSRQLLVPHLAFGRTAPRSLGHCERTTGYGGQLQITVNESLVIVPNPGWIINPWPAEGSQRFVKDLLLQLAVRQYVLEIKKSEESGYRGYGTMFTEEANRIGLSLGLSPVVVRRRPGHEDDGPPCHGWPHCVRPADYYGDDITEDLLRLAAGGTSKPSSSPKQNMGILELLHYLLANDRVNDALRLIERHRRWVERAGSTGFPVRRSAERGDVDVDGSPLGAITFDRTWLKWNNGTVRLIAESITTLKTFVDLPILADALEEAGCQDARILRHLREQMTHDSGCWALRLLLALDQ
jgi:hypothetical protein